FDADALELAEPLFELVGRSLDGDHDREAQRFAAGARRRVVDALLPLPRLAHRRSDGVVLVGMRDGGGNGARLRAAADDDRRARPLHWLRPHVVGGRPLTRDLHELTVELVETRALRAEREAVRLVLRLVPAGADAELDATIRDVIRGRDELGEHRRAAEGDRRDERAEADRARDRCEAADRAPGVECSVRVAAHDRAVVVGAEEGVELRVLRRACERDPLRPGDALLALDHQREPHHSGVTYAAVNPPSTRNVEPVTYDDSSEARNSAPLTTSRAFARRPVGQCRRRRSSAAGSSPKMRRRSGVSTGPGQSALTRTLSRANCTASSRVIDSTAPFDAVY